MMLPGRPRRHLLRLAMSGAALMGRRGLEKLEYLERPSLGPALYLAVRGLFAPRQIRELLGISEGELDAWGPALGSDSDVRKRAAVDDLVLLEIRHYLQNQLLKDIDAMSMAHSVETRVPYLDHLLVEYVVGLPSRLKLAGGRNKPLLLHALDGALPRPVWDRPKMGFVLPFERWLRERAGELEAMSLERKLFQDKAVRRVWDEFRKGRLHWSRAWALVVLARFQTGRRKAA